jgi:nucleoside-triphosphatase
VSELLAKNLLLTGPPECGKMTVIRRLVERLANRSVAGFYTQAIRLKGQRVGFEVRGLKGGRGILAHVGFQSSHRFRRYDVDLGAFERIIRYELIQGRGNVGVYIIDEIGKMESFSPVFIQAVAGILDSPMPVVATSAAKGGRLIAQAETRPDVETIMMTAENRDGLPADLASRLSSQRG